MFYTNAVEMMVKSSHTTVEWLNWQRPRLDYQLGKVGRCPGNPGLPPIIWYFDKSQIGWKLVLQK